MEKQIFNLRLASKELARNSKKCEHLGELEKTKVKAYLKKGNIDIAKIHAENAIRQKNQSIYYLQISARIDGIVSRIQTAITTKNISKSMAGVLRAMDASMKGMDLTKVSTIMDKFELELENFNIHGSCIENTMAQIAITTLPLTDVDKLLKQIADENNLELNMALAPCVPSDGILNLTNSRQTVQEPDDLSKRLSKLRNTL